MSINQIKNNNREYFSSYKPFDVLSGRGRRVQTHVGNINYRKLVFVNKALYKNSPESDKLKISKGIVSAVRHLGGRFLQFDSRSERYTDIGDTVARKKTSQALRDSHEGKMGANSLNLTSINSTVNTSKASLSQEDYLKYSVKVLEFLFRSDSGLPPKLELSSLASQSSEIVENSLPSVEICHSSHRQSYTVPSNIPNSSAQIETTAERNTTSFQDAPSGIDYLIELILKEDEDWKCDGAFSNRVQDPKQSNSIVENNDSLVNNDESQVDFGDAILMVMNESISTFQVPADWDNMEFNSEYLARLRSHFQGVGEI